MAETTRDAGAQSIFQQKSYVRFWLSRVFSTLSFQMASVAVGWQIYELSHSTFALGIVGLVQFLPIFLLTLLVGHVADRFDRKLIMSVCQTVAGVTLAVLAIGQPAASADGAVDLLRGGGDRDGAGVRAAFHPGSAAECR